MKKRLFSVLSWMLSMVMLMSLMPISAGATDFVDEDEQVTEGLQDDGNPVVQHNPSIEVNFYADAATATGQLRTIYGRIKSGSRLITGQPFEGVKDSNLNTSNADVSENNTMIVACKDLAPETDYVLVVAYANNVLQTVKGYEETLNIGEATVRKIADVHTKKEDTVYKNPQNYLCYFSLDMGDELTPKFGTASDEIGEGIYEVRLYTKDEYDKSLNGRILDPVSESLDLYRVNVDFGTKADIDDIITCDEKFYTAQKSNSDFVADSNTVAVFFANGKELNATACENDFNGTTCATTLSNLINFSGYKVKENLGWVFSQTSSDHAATFAWRSKLIGEDLVEPKVTVYDDGQKEILTNKLYQENSYDVAVKDAALTDLLTWKDTGNSVTLEAKQLLPSRINRTDTPDYWLSFAVVAPTGAKSVQFKTGDEERKILDKLVSVDDVNDSSKKGVIIYVPVSTGSEFKYSVQFFDSESVPVTEVYTLNVNAAAERNNALETNRVENDKMTDLLSNAKDNKINRVEIRALPGENPNVATLVFDSNALVTAQSSTYKNYDIIVSTELGTITFKGSNLEKIKKGSTDVRLVITRYTGDNNRNIVKAGMFENMQGVENALRQIDVFDVQFYQGSTPLPLTGDIDLTMKLQGLPEITAGEKVDLLHFVNEDVDRPEIIQKNLLPLDRIGRTVTFTVKNPSDYGYFGLGLRSLIDRMYTVDNLADIKAYEVVGDIAGNTDKLTPTFKNRETGKTSFTVETTAQKILFKLEEGAKVVQNGTPVVITNAEHEFSQTLTQPVTTVQFKYGLNTYTITITKKLTPENATLKISKSETTSTITYEIDNADVGRSYMVAYNKTNVSTGELTVYYFVLKKSVGTDHLKFYAPNYKADKDVYNLKMMVYELSSDEPYINGKMNYNETEDRCSPLIEIGRSIPAAS